MYASSVAEWRYGVRCAPCGVWAVRAYGARARERERRGQGRETAERRGARAQGRERQHRQWDSTAEYCGRGGSRHFRRHRGFIPEGSLFMSLRAIGYLLTHAACLLSVRKKNKCRNEETTARREVYRTPYWGKEKIVQ